MDIHANAALGPAGRLALVEAIESGMTLRAAAAALNVAPATAHRWWHRWLGADQEQRDSRTWLHDRPCTPHRQPRRLVRGRGGADPESTAPDRPRARSVGRNLPESALDDLEGPPSPRGSPGARAGSARPIVAMSGLARVPCCTWTSSAWPALRSPATPSPPTGGTPTAGLAGNTCTSSSMTSPAWPTSSAIPGEDAETNAATLERAIAWFASLGLDPPEAVMTDNAMVYRKARIFKELLQRQGARHILTPPYTPRWNGKAERFIQTLQREWAYAHQWRTSTERLRSLSSFLRYYNGVADSRTAPQPPPAGGPWMRLRGADATPRVTTSDDKPRDPAEQTNDSNRNRLTKRAEVASAVKTETTRRWTSEDQ